MTNRILLTGAGFTHNFGAPLASKVSEMIFNFIPEDSMKLRTMLQNNFDFEHVYQIVIQSQDYSNNEKIELTAAIKKTYDHMNQLINSNNLAEGERFPAIVIGSAFYYPRTFSQNLRNHLRFTFMDHRGFAPHHGGSPLTQSEYELEVIIDDIEHLRKYLGLDQIVIIGHSGHGFMALEYAKKYPEHVSHVVMLGIIPNLSAESNIAIEQYWQDSVSPDRKAALKVAEQKLSDDKLTSLSPSQRFIKQYIRSGARIWYDFNFDSSPLWKDVEINMEIFTYIWGTVFRDIDITRELDKFDKPIFLGLGRYDFLAPYCLWNPIRSKFKNLTVRVFEKSGHTPQYEEPELFDAELIKWLYQKN